MRHFKKRQGISIRSHLIMQILLFIIPIITVLFISNILAIHIITVRVEELNYNTLYLCMKNMEERLNDVDRCLYNLLVNEKAVQYLDESEDEDRRSLNVISVNQLLKEDLTAYSILEGIFVYVPKWNLCVNVKNTNEVYLDQNVFRKYASEIHEAVNYSKSPYSHMRWHLTQIGDTVFLTGDVSAEKMHIGAYMRGESYLETLYDGMGDQYDYLCLRDSQYAVWSSPPPENRKDYLEICVENFDGQYELIGLVRKKSMLDSFMMLQNAVLICTSGVAVMLIIFLLNYVRKVIINPVEEVAQAMQKVREGDLAVRLEQKKEYWEFYEMGECFNGMVSQIEGLKISAYEENLKKQKAQLNFLQLQSSPHYLLNSLNVLYGLAQKKEWETLKKMILTLSGYSRYMLKGSCSEVLLAEELEHVRQYVLMQKERVAYPVEYKEIIDTGLPHILIPPLLIHTFVENSFKYGVSPDHVMRICVEVRHEKCNDRQGTKIIVYDEGTGFSEHVLEALQEGKPIIDDWGNEHYGIENIMQRVELIYGKQIGIMLSNRKNGGAQAEIFIPFK